MKAYIKIELVNHASFGKLGAILITERTTHATHPSLPPKSLILGLQPTQIFGDYPPPPPPSRGVNIAYAHASLAITKDVEHNCESHCQ